MTDYKSQATANNACCVSAIVLNVVTLAVSIVFRCMLPMLTALPIMLALLIVAIVGTITLRRATQRFNDGCYELEAASFVISVILLAFYGLICALDTFSVLDTVPLMESTPCTTEAEVINVVSKDSGNQLVVEYTDGNGTTQRASLKLRGKPLYKNGDIISIRYNPEKPTRVCAGHLTTEMTLDDIMSSEMDPKVIGLTEFS